LGSKTRKESASKTRKDLGSKKGGTKPSDSVNPLATSRTRRFTRQRTKELPPKEPGLLDKLSSTFGFKKKEEPTKEELRSTMKENQEKAEIEARIRQEKIDEDLRAENARKALEDAYEKQRQADIKAGVRTLDELNDEKARNAELRKQ
jgi:hypothetical protein